MAIIVVVGFGVTLAIMSKSITGRISGAVENASHYYDDTRAKNIASSAVEIYLRKVKEGDVGVGSYSINSIMGGRADIVISNSIDKNAAVKPDSLLMTTISKFNPHYEGTSYVLATDTIVTLVATNLSVNEPSITGGVAVSSDVTTANISIQNSGSKLTGLNYDPVTGLRDSSYASVDAISMENRSDVNYPSLNFNNVDVTGVQGGPTPPDTESVGAIQPNYGPLVSQLIGLRDTMVTSGNSTSYTWGTQANPKIVYMKWTSGGQITMSGVISGVGILLIDGKWNFSQALHWKGLVVVVGNATSGNSSVSISGNNNSYGAMLMTGPYATLQMPGAADFKYSAEAVNWAFSIPKLQGNYIVYDWWE